MKKIYAVVKIGWDGTNHFHKFFEHREFAETELKRIKDSISSDDVWFVQELNLYKHKGGKNEQGRRTDCQQHEIGSQNRFRFQNQRIKSDD